jgi:Bacterial PH domain
MFTNKRIIAVNRRGMTGSKVDISSLPYSKIQAFSIETDRGHPLELITQIRAALLGKSVTTEKERGSDLIVFA